MGFQVADVQPLALEIARKDGVTGVWLLSDPDEKSCSLLVAVKGLNDAGRERRMQVRELVEMFISQRQPDMEDSRLLFDYRIAVDEAGLGPVHIPSGATEVTAA